MPIIYLDDLLAGETLLDMYGAAQQADAHEISGLSAGQIKEALDKMASYAADHPTDAAGSFLYRPEGKESTVFVDGIGLACPFLYRYGEMFGGQEYKELALRQIVNFCHMAWTAPRACPITAMMRRTVVNTGLSAGEGLSDGCFAVWRAV